MAPEPVRVLREGERLKLDASDDSLFYAEPRFVQHLDAAFRAGSRPCTASGSQPVRWFST